jgi:predicted TIM-barrel fold metal-dependent hydrolase
MKDIIYIDCFASFGKRGPKDKEAAWSKETLLEEMEHCGIHGALVYHSLAREYDPMFGNRMLMNEIKDSPRLFPCWVLLPHHTGEVPPGKKLIKKMLENGVRAAKMYPRVHHYALNEDTCGELFSALEDAEIPLFIEGGQVYGGEQFIQLTFEELDAVCTRHKKLKVVLQGMKWESTRLIYPLMRKHKHLHVEFSNYQLEHAYEIFVQWFGAERILFSTGALEKSPGAAKAYLDYAQISLEDKKKIGGRNLARLLKLKQLPPEYPTTKETDSILALVKEAVPLNHIPVIDAHCHLNEDGALGVGFKYQPYGDATSTIERGKLIGIQKMCVSSWLGIWADYELGNEIIYSAVRRFPDHYIGYATLEPTYVKDWNAEFKKVYEQYGFKGLKPYYPRTLIPYNDKKWYPWFEYGNRHRYFALIHPSDNMVKEILDTAAKFPKISFLLAHSGGSFKDARKAIEVAKQRKNVYLEITLTAVTYGVIEFMVEELGADRVVFGTDQPLRDPIPQFGWVAYTRLPEKDKRKIFGENMRTIIARCR